MLMLLDRVHLGSKYTFQYNNMSVITFDNFTESDPSGNTTGTATFTHQSFSPGVILVGVMLDSLSESVTVVGYNANPLTQLYNVKVGFSAQLWVGYFVYPNPGTFNVAVNFTGGVTVFRTAAITFAGIYSSPIGGSASNTAVGGTNNSISATPPLQGGTGVVVDFFSGIGVLSGNAQAPATEVMNNTGLWGGGANHLAGVAYRPHTGSSFSMTWENLPNGGGKLLYAVELLPIPVGQAGTIQII